MNEVSGKSPVIRLSLACNHYRNGMYAGRASSIEACDCMMASPYADASLKCEINQDGFTLGKSHWWKHYGEKQWYGNWCWNALWVAPRTVVEVVNFALTKGYRFESATEPFLNHCDGQPWILELVEQWMIGRVQKKKRG